MAGNLLSKSNGIQQKTGGIIGFPGKPVTDAIINGFFTVDRNWTVKYWNKAAEKLSGVAAKDILDRNLWETLADKIPLTFYEVYHKAFLQDTPQHFEEYLGEMGIWHDVIVYHAEGRLSVSFKGERHPKQQLKILNELYRFISEVTNDCLWELNFQTKELFWIDGGHKRIFGYPIENALIPQSFWETRIHPEDKARVLTRLQSIVAEGAAIDWEEEYRFKRAGGDYAYVHDRGHIVYEGKIATRMIGATHDISARKIAEQTLVEERLSKQKEITYAVLTAQEAERTEIGKQLHDNLNQILGAAKLYIEMSKSENEHREYCLEKASGYIVDVIDEIGRISKTLGTPGMIMGLFDSVRILIDDLALQHPVKFEFIEQGVDEEDLDEKMQVDIFKMVQEQTDNIIKHSKATSALVELSREGNDIILLISDNGQGCDLLKARIGLGIINMMSRSELYHGTVSTESKPGKGYTLKVVLPLNGHVNILQQLSDYDDFD